jgi:hypothetical protein
LAEREGVAIDLSGPSMKPVMHVGDRASVQPAHHFNLA